MTLSETEKLSTGPTFPVFRISSPRDEVHCSATVVRLDDHTPAHRALSQVTHSSKNWPPLWSWLAATARTPTPFMDPADRQWYTLQHSCRMVQSLSSWSLWVDATDLCCLCDLMMMMMPSISQHKCTAATSQM